MPMRTDLSILLESVRQVCELLDADPQHFGARVAQLGALMPWLTADRTRVKFVREVTMEEALQLIKECLPDFTDGEIFAACARARPRERASDARARAAGARARARIE